MTTNAPREKFYRLVRTTNLYGSRELTERIVLHSRRCHYTTGRCTCRSALDRLPAGTVVTVSTATDSGALVTIAEFAPVWIERGNLEQVKAPTSAPPEEAIPRDYLNILEKLGSGWVPTRTRRKPAGGTIVFVRSDESPSPWRFVGRVHDDGQLCALLVDPSVPRHRVLEVERSHVRIVPLGGKGPESVLMVADPDQGDDPTAERAG